MKELKHVKVAPNDTVYLLKVSAETFERFKSQASNRTSIPYTDQLSIIKKGSLLGFLAPNTDDALTAIVISKRYTRVDNKLSLQFEIIDPVDE